MKILLINPPALDGIVADMSDYFDKSGGAYPPIGLMYLASFLNKSGRHDVKILDANVMGLDYAGIQEAVRLYKPDVVGIGALTFYLPAVLRIASDVKAVAESTLTVLGGPHVTIYPEETLSFTQVDFVVLGEGEIVFSKLVDAIESNSGFGEIDSIGFKRNGEIVINRRSLFIEDLNSLPFPAIDLIKYRKYCSVLSPEKHTMVMISSRGCPFNCIYCDRPHLGRKFRARSATNVVDEMESYARSYNINDIKFFDDTFTVDRKRVVQLCDEITKRNLKVTWSVRARVNTVDYDLLKIMSESGMNSVSFGIESGNQRILDNLQKGITIEQVVDAVDNCKKLGIEVLGDFILGCPGERKEQIEETIAFSRKLGLDYAQFTIMTPYPSTQLYKMGLERGIIKNDYWRDFAKKPSRDFVTPVWKEFYSKEKLVEFLKKAYRSFYFRPEYIMNRIGKIKSVREVIRKFGAFIALVRLNFLSKSRLVGNFKKSEQ